MEQQSLEVDAAAAFVALADAAHDTAPVSGLTHNFYKYPARFPPKLVRSIIEQFSAPGDLVVDPFMGGGTTLVEALALGREAIGLDISALATFVAEVKTTVYTDRALAIVGQWQEDVRKNINMRRTSVPSWFYESNGYYRNIDSKRTWRYRKAIEQALFGTSGIRNRRARALARCIILRTAQWALDGRRNLPSIDEFRNALDAFADEMVDGAQELRRVVEGLPEESRMPVRCINGSAIGLPEYFDSAPLRKPKLIITSPPYPGVHVLYHRWQVDGRKETPAPFWIVDKLDGAGSSYYTMGDRKYPHLATYFTQLKLAFTSIASICDVNTTVVQVVGFSEPGWQLPQYLSVAQAVGLTEITPPSVPGLRDGRLWRRVPNRKWHAYQFGEIPASQEVVLFHRRA